MSAVLARPSVTRSFRYLAAAAVLINASIHLWLYVDEYRDVHIIGLLFLVNAAAGALLAVGLAAAPRGLYGSIAVGYSALTLAAFGLSRTVGLFGFQEHDVDVKAMATTVAEAVAIIVLALWFAHTRPRANELPVVGGRVSARPRFEQTRLPHSDPATPTAPQRPS